MSLLVRQALPERNGTVTGMDDSELQASSSTVVTVLSRRRAIAGGPAGPAAAGPIFGKKKKSSSQCKQLRMSTHDVCNK